MIYQGLSDGELGLCQSQILLVHEAVLNLPFSHLCHQNLYPSDVGQESIPRFNVFEHFLRNFVRRGPGLCSCDCKKMWRENVPQCVRLWEVCTWFFWSCLHSCPGPTRNSSVAIPSGRAIILCRISSLSSQLSFILCQFHPLCVIYPADFSFTSGCPLSLLH